MRAIAVRLLQKWLVGKGHELVRVDGKLGPNTYGATQAELEKQGDNLPVNWQEWSNRRKCIGMLQLICKENNVEVGKVDGRWGPQTEYGFDTLVYLQENGEFPPNFRDEIVLEVNPNDWPNQAEEELINYYGERGENQTRLELPYRHRLCWDLRKTVHSLLCHEKVHDSAQRVLTRVLDFYGLERIVELRLDRWGGCLNVRKMRGGSRWSMHSWGIAFDYDTEFNQYNWGRDRATLARPEYEAWWRFWEEEGWLSLGRTRNFDWMHVQAAKL